MKIILLFCLIIWGCSNKYYNNGIYENTFLIQQDISIELLETTNSVFNIYEFNSKFIGILPKKQAQYNSGSSLDKINKILIFDESQLQKLKQTLEAIIDKYDSNKNSELTLESIFPIFNKNTEETKIIDFHIIQEIEKQVTTSGLYYEGLLLTKTSQTGPYRTLFRLQSISHNNKNKILCSFIPSKVTNSIFITHTPMRLKIKDVKNLLNDIKKY